MSLKISSLKEISIKKILLAFAVTSFTGRHKSYKTKCCNHNLVMEVEYQSIRSCSQMYKS